MPNFSIRVKIAGGRFRCVYLTVADPVVGMLPRAQGWGEGVVGSLYVLLSICLGAWWYFLLDLGLVDWTRLVEGDPELVILGLLCLWLHEGAAIEIEIIESVDVFWPVATLAPSTAMVGSRASLSVRASPPRALTSVRLRRSSMRGSSVAIPPRDDVSDPPEDKNNK